MRLLTVHKITLKELSAYFLLSLGFLNSILMMEKLIRLSRILSGVGATVSDFINIMLYIQPQLLILTIPMAMLFATLLTYGRMNADNEIVVMKTAGMSMKRISMPVFVLGMVSLLISFAVTFHLSPLGSKKLREAITQIITVRSTLSLEEGAFNTSFRDIVIMIKGKKTSDTMQDIFIYDNRQKETPRVLMAKEGRFFSSETADIGLQLIDGHINITNESKVTDIYFNKYNMTMNIGVDSPAPKRAELTPAELMAKIRTEESKKKKAYIYLDLHRRFSLPAVSIILMFLGPPLALIAGRSGRLGGLALGLATFTLYYILLIYGENLATAGKIHHLTGGWAATAVLGIFSGFMFIRSSSE
jgi:lipopolysaccharide export system permease protein